MNQRTVRVALSAMAVVMASGCNLGNSKNAGPCGGQTCDPNASCVTAGNSSQFCLCNPGFEGSGTSCTVSVEVTDGGSDGGVSDGQPEGLAYATNPAVYTKGVAITNNTPSTTGGDPVVSYTITPALPAGLNLSKTTGVISGTPTTLAVATVYVVTATNKHGSATVALTITVNDVPPSGLTYATSPATYTLGKAIANNTPKLGGGPVLEWSIAPALPSGLSFSQATGVISGTPSALAAMTSYTVTATNSGGSTTAMLVITVNDVAPSGLTYATNPAVYTNGQMITNDTPSTTGGAVVSWSITPALPAGLSFDTTTGIVSGTPAALAPATAYMVTATNTGGSTTATLTVTVNDVPPMGLSYATNPVIYTKGQLITNNTPSTTGGGPVVSYAITPGLPAGLSFSTTTGIISGTPTALLPATSFTVKATNTGGSATVALNLTVNDVPPSGLSYTTGTAVFTKGQAIASDAPSSSGGAVVSYAMSPPPPSGLSFSTTTGVLSGTPTAVTPTSSYTVTATNTGGLTSATLTLTVNDVAPSRLTYGTNPAVYTLGHAITNDVLQNSGGAVVSYAINPSLPGGLSFSTTTGVVSGAPTVLSPSAAYVVTATNTGGSTTATLTVTVNDVPPSGLTYATPVVYTKGTAITPNTPSTTGGGPVVSYAISPALPAGLSLDPVAGVISGTPAALSPAANYTVTATNTGGSTTATVNLAVIDVAPAGLTYGTNPAIYTKGQAIAADAPSTASGGPVVSYAISPALPAGLSLSTTTGIISGTPTALSPAASYTVTATNTGGSTSVSVSITVNDVPPAGLSYAKNPAVYTKGTAITNNTPSTTGGGPVISWAISPALPAGLSFSATTGVLSGTPTALSPAASYMVTATNSGGSANATVSIAVIDVPPAGLSYATNPVVYTKGQTIASDAPSLTGGGPAVSWTVSPALPAGLTLSSTTGVLSGTPTAVAAQAAYVVVATNTGGSTTATLTLTVNDVPPSGLSYATNPAVYTKGVEIASNAPSTTGGGAVISYSITPALPAGLSFNTDTGVISGTPSALSPTAGYAVTATNSGGSTTTALTVTVNDAAPTGLTYRTNPAIYTKGQTITSNVPSIAGGGAVTSYTITPALPAGLSFSATTGVLSGTPTTLAPTASYTVTATNSGGSTSATLTITVNDVAPSGLSYSPNPAVYTRNQTIANNTPVISGGAVVSWAISPAPPAGLVFSTTTGVLSGTPALVSAETPYTVTATNSGGFTTATLTLTINDVPPPSLTYTENPAVYTIWQAIAQNAPESSAGVISYSITPALPAGLDFNTATGIITGTPVALSPATYYTVTATNSGGSVNATLSIAVVDVPPSGLDYSTNPAVYTKGQLITNNTPSTASGGTVISWAIAPPLPAGLSFSTTTGVISGTPTALSPATSYTVTATNSGGSTTTTLTLTVNDVAPSGLSYAVNPAVYTKGQAIANNTPTSSGGTVISWTIAPALPAGLSFNTTTGVISGTPTALAAATGYAVTATNSGGSTNVALTLSVVDVPPSGLSYTLNPAVYTKGAAITANTPSTLSGGPVVSWAISPPLPAGLNFSTTTGVISGTPTTVAPTANYTVTATNTGGSSNTTLVITVNDLAPASLTYTTNPAVFTKGVTITNDSPLSSGGAVTSYTISPALPAGLSFSTTTGVISGTPAVLSTATPYTVTATNSGGSTNVTLNITVNDAAPSSLVYTTNPAVYTKGQTITANVPSSSGGAVVSWTISPALPAGLSFSTTTGVLSGTPTVLSPATSYTVTATNTGGLTTVSLSVTVNDVPPSGLTYATNPAVYTKGTAIASNAPSISGGPVVSYAISPSLPAGLTLSATTGVISGTPTVLSPAATYTVTATNSGGSTTAALNIAVIDVPPSGLSYTTNPATYTKGVAIANNTPVVSGGAVVSWAISPALPAGLSFSTTTGVMTGTPTALSPTTGYTVTATNSGGTTSVALTITVNDVAPSGLSYPTNPAVFTKGVEIANDTPVISGGAITSWSVLPALPAGLSFSTTTGVVSGTPTALSPTASYTVTATNSGGSTSVALTITVNDVAPSGLSYTLNPATYTKGSAIASNSPSLSGGGPVVSYAISPAPPAGLSFSATTGVLSGTPTVVAATASYTVTATNTGGSTSVALSITVNDVAPSGLGYATNPAVYTLGALITNDIPTISGGAVTSWSISPPLPTGLSFSTTTGVVSGTPTVLSPTASYVVTATNSGGSTTVTLSLTVDDVAPSGLSYATNPAVYTKGHAIASNTPTIGGGPVTSWSISPALPSGLTLSATTGVLSGTPTVLAPAANYTVTASNTGGSTTATLNITVEDVAPTGLTYTLNPAVYTKGTAITANTPLISGGPVVSWAVSPTLPAGLSFSSTTGAITGTPTVLSSAAGYTVTATNSGGSTLVTLTLSVVDVPPSGLSYAVNPAVFTKGTAITSDTPVISGGPVTSWAIAPALPAGLSFSATTGVISGTPTALSPATNYAVTATNSGGSTSTTLSLTVNDIPPSGLSYPTSPVVATLGVAIANDTPVISGGPVVAWSISPPLPAGLSLSATTGVLSGTPVVLSPSASYTVTATNTGGSTSVTLSITVNDVAPSSLTYSANPAIYTENLTITNNVPANSGGAVVSYAISPTLPAGLSFSTTTGVISGTPTVLSSATSYTVTATNTGGSTTALLSITVNSVAPPGLTYSANPAVYTKGTTITPDTPSSGGITITSYAISPALPAGLSFSTATGVISGTPTALSPAANYTVTAANSGGSITATLNLAVIDVPPSGLSYPTNPAVYTKGQLITSDTPVISGGPVVAWAISPALPAGLSFSTTTGVISGTPTVLSPAAGYAVTATNSGGATLTTLTLSVVDVPPSSLSYSTNPAIYTLGASITNDTPVISGGPVTAWTITPTLPAGLSFSTSTGVISGTPAALSPATSYTVTAANSGGATSVTLSLAVEDVPPSGLTYTTNPAVYTKGTVITANLPEIGGGPVVSWSVSPALPAGLSLSPTTGAISGTPAVLSTATDYTVTATNSGGATNVTLNITVNDAAPSGLTYPANPAVFTKGTLITNDTPSNSGGAVVSWAISPTLPAGLSFDPTTGILSGTPTVVSPTTPYTVTATNTGGFTTATLTITVNDVAPTGLSYATNPVVYTKGVLAANDTPVVSGGAVTVWTITPTLPAGLSFSTTTGVISGTATVLSPAASYTVTATNSGGSTTAVLNLSVVDVPPSGLSYATNPAVYTNGTAITANTPSLTGGGPVTSYAITPALPAGLSFSTTTGILSGTPAAVSAETAYTVTAANSGGSTTATLNLTVNDVAPSSLTYATNPATYTIWQAIADDTPTSSGGAVVSWEITPALPAGLSLNTASGVISGTPIVLSPQADYTVTATNSGGSTTATVSITVDDAAPYNLAYSKNPAVYTKGSLITNNTPSASGGAILSYAITPSLPAGLSFSTTTGIISGTPTALAPAAGYTVTATNTGGSAEVTLTISVVDVPPSGLTYSSNPAVYTKGTLITNDTPSLTGGGPVISYAISPALPTGLSFNTTTGVISGTPSVLSPAAGYTVTATNTGGSIVATLTLSVVDVPPASLSYPTNPAVYTKGVAISSDTPTISGGPVVSWSIAPTLPTGLSFSTTNGSISGTPTVLSSATVYTVTATNSGGSTTTTLTLTVNDVAPAGLSYATNPATYTESQAITSNIPTISGGPVVSWSVSPALPAGLSLSATTGVISGTPVVLSTATAYTVTATNSGGSTTDTITITVNDSAPSNLTYLVNPAVYTKGTLITNDVPSNSGGVVVSYAINPTLPAGLSFSTTTGVVSGTPTALSAATAYTVTATNTGGSTTATLTITVNDVKPSGLTYAVNPAVYTKGTLITSDTPTISGGPVTLWAISPTLPTGLSFSTSTGVVSGTPSVLSTATAYTVTATNTGGSTTATLTITVNDVAPSGLTYSTNPAVYTKGSSIANNSPTLTGGGPVISYAISPTLPAGLSFSTTTGIVSGTPTALATTTGYTVTATNTGGSTTATLTITVNDIAPSGLIYSANPATYTKGAPIANNSPTLTGGGPVISYSVSPALPAGLSLSTTTGIISGTPTVLSTATPYTITATNTGGSTTATLTITVNDVAPSGISYTVNPAVYTKGTAIATNAASTSGGGPVTSWSISPTLPTGLSFSTSTGAVTGTPTALSAATGYTVTATNTGGSTTVTLTITVNDVAPSGLTYTLNPAVYTKGTAIATNSPTLAGGGPVISYAIAPSLPAGLSFSTSSGAVTGTPSVLAATTGYTVTATNTGGSTTATLTITVNDVAPSGLTYSANPATYTKGSPIADNKPSLTGGGPVVSYSVSPALPTGLSLSTTTGIISGTPTVLSTATAYTITATNTGGSTTDSLTITVNDVPPSGITYTLNPAVYTKGTAITTNAASTSGGGTVISWSISPSLPTGLSFNTANGAVTGTPTVLSTATAYTVTATNTGGSTTATLTITVNDVAPSSLAYTLNPAVYTKGTAIATNGPTSTGGPVVSYAISPALPAGLTFTTSSGQITGTPTALSPQANYVVTATNTGGSTSVTLVLTVNDVIPSGLSYTLNPAVYTKGTAIATNSPTISGGPVVTWAISPALPAGLSFSTSTGYITGTPTALSAITTYTVTATNSGGSATVTLHITVNDVPPSGLSYSLNPAIYNLAQLIANNVPTIGGGPVVTWSVSPALPAGLTLSTTTGIISGSPTAAATLAAYVVTATNSGGSTTASVTITVNGGGTTGLSGTIAGGEYHTCAVVNGGAQCWGSNQWGQLGNNSTTQSDIPVQVQGLTSGVQAIAVGAESEHTCAIVNGGIQCWGYNGYGELGNNSMVQSDTPVQVQGMTSGAQAVAEGELMTCALVNGGAWCWGYNANGQLGNNSATNSSVPVQVQGLTSGVQQVTTGSWHGCALTNGGVWCWGGNWGAMLGNNSGIEQSYVPVQVTGLNGSGVLSGVQTIAGGTDQTCAIVNGAAECWGWEANGDLGNNSVTNSYVPVQVSGLTSGVEAISAGWSHGCAIVNGAAQCWGNNSGGQLGNNSVTQSDVPVAVQGLSIGVQALAAVGYSTCAIDSSGVQCWGQNQYGQLGNNSVTQSTVPGSVQGISSGVQAVATGAFHTCELLQDGVWCWGENTNGQLGDETGLNSSEPVQVAGLSSGVQAIAAGSLHTCALTNGAVECWGENSYGALGNNSTVDTLGPVQVSGLLSGVQSIAAGQDHTCAVLNGSVECWGQNSNGQLGNNSTTQSNVPVTISTLTAGVQAVAVGAFHSCALVNGGVQCWGENANGQLGNNSTTDSHVPVQVTGLSVGVQAITAGNYHTCALVNGGIQCWGDNAGGDLGNNSTTQSDVPVAVTGLTAGVQFVAAGSSQTCALVNGSVQCWGTGTSGQLGNGATTNSTVPVQVTSLSTGAQAIATGGGALQGCALVNGGVQCWGDNLYGELGNQSTISSSVPVGVSF